MTREPEPGPPSATEERALRSRLERLRRHGESVVRLAKSPALVEGDLEALAREATELTADALEVERVSIWRLSAQRDRLDCLDLFERGPRRHGGAAALAVQDYPRYFESLEQGRAIDADRAQRDPRTAELVGGYLEPLGITSMLDAGIRFGGRIVGVLCHEHVGEPRRWSEEELGFAAAVADQLASALVNAERLEALEGLRDSERRLEQANRMLRLVLDAIPVRVFWKDRESRYLGCNARFARDAGRERPTSLIGGTDFDMGWAEQAELYRADDREVMQSGEPKIGYEEPQTTPDGQRIWLRTSKIPLRDPEGEVIGVLGTYEDITERKRTEDELARYRDRLEQLVEQRTAALVTAQEKLVAAERLAALGQVTATVAHEVRNPLGTIRTALFSLQDAHAAGDVERIARAHELAERSIRRCDGIIEELLDFSRRRVLAPRERALGVWLDALLDEQQPPDGVRLERDLDGAPRLCFDGEQLRRALVNLLENAYDAVRDPGAAGPLVRVTARAEGERARIEVEDQGVGMARGDLERIREPLFSTKSFGVGLGVPVVVDVAEAHGGSVEFRSRPGAGTTATLWLPLAAGGAP